MPEETPPDIHSLLADVLSRLATIEREVAALRAAGRSLAALVPYTPPTDEELQDMLHGPRGRHLREVIEECQKECQEG